MIWVDWGILCGIWKRSHDEDLRDSSRGRAKKRRARQRKRGGERESRGVTTKSRVYMAVSAPCRLSLPSTRESARCNSLWRGNEKNIEANKRQGSASCPVCPCGIYRLFYSQLFLSPPSVPLIFVFRELAYQECSITRSSPLVVNRDGRSACRWNVWIAPGAGLLPSTWRPTFRAATLLVRRLMSTGSCFGLASASRGNNWPDYGPGVF